MEVILDTNALSAILDGNTDIQAIAASRGPFWLPAIVIGEYWFGLLSSKKRRPLELYFRQLVDKCIVLKVEQPTAEIYAQIRFELKQKGRPLPDNDIWIAALARQHNLSLVSRDSHFDDVDGIRRISW
jgi:predicted nucleic acid-binding protein